MRPMLKQLAAVLLLSTVAVSCATTSTLQPVRRGFHSNIADIWLPEGATLDPASNDKLEMWQANAPLTTSTQAMTSLLPVNQPLGGLPWRDSTTAGDPKGIYWAWGTSTDMVSVGVSEIMGQVRINIGHSPPANGVCQPQ
jgi:hypothetical protein